MRVFKFTRRILFAAVSVLIILGGMVLFGQKTEIPKKLGQVLAVTVSDKFINSLIPNTVSAANPAPYQNVSGDVAISGNISIGTATAGSSVMRFMSAAGPSDLYMDVEPGTRTIRTRNWNTASPNVLATGIHTGTLITDGNVGIGTASPATKLEVKGGHGDTRFRLFYDTGGGLDGVNTANLNLWASEPGSTYTGAGIGNNAWNNGGIQRVTTTRGGSYVRLLDNAMSLNVIDSAGTDRNGITINGAGNVGIGTVSPAGRLQVFTAGSGDGSIDSELFVGEGIGQTTALTSSTKAVRISGYLSGPWNAGRLGSPNVVGATFFEIGGTNHDGNHAPVEFNSGSIALKVNSTSGNSYSSRLAFNTLANSFVSPYQATEKMSILGNGYVGIGTTGPSYPLHVIDAGNTGSGTSIVGKGAFKSYDGTNLDSTGTWAFGAGAFSSDTNKFSIYYVPNGKKVIIDTAGNLAISGLGYQPGGGSWASSSDSRLKKNIKPIANALDKIQQLQGVNFEWINPGEHGNATGTQGGFIAQQIEKIFPNWITRIDPSGNDKNLVGIGGKIKNLALPFEYDALVVEAIKEQQAEIKTLQAENAALESRLRALENKVK